MRLVCLVDLDGVLTSFWDAALAVHGKAGALEPRDVTWGFPAQIGFPGGAGDPAFWAKMDYEFWLNLPWTHEGRTLLEGLERIFLPDNIAILTSPCDTHGAVEGKVDWLRRELPAYQRRFFVGPPKELLASAHHVLIDDHEPHIERFRAAGGHALLVPRPWNSRKPATDAHGRFHVGDFLAEVRNLAGRLRPQRGG